MFPEWGMGEMGKIGEGVKRYTLSVIKYVMGMYSIRNIVNNIIIMYGDRW